VSPFEHVAQKKLSEARRAAFQFSAWSKPSRRTDSEHSRKRRIHLAFVLSTPPEIASPASPIAHGRCERIFCEKESGAKDDRLQLKRLLKALKRDDMVIISALDRLRRGGPFKTLSILNEITSRGAAYRSLAEPWADTTHELGEVLAALVGYIARKTREDIIRRTTAGR
jgi:hypothetical protein